MAPVSRSAIEVYQAMNKKRMKRMDKKSKKQHLQQQSLLADVNESTSQNGGIQREILNLKSEEPTFKVKSKKKALKRLAAGVPRSANGESKRIEKQPPKEAASAALLSYDSVSGMTIATSSSKSAVSPEKKPQQKRSKKSKDFSNKKTKEDSPKVAEESPVRTKENSAKRAKNDSTEKYEEGLSNATRTGLAKKSSGKVSFEEDDSVSSPEENIPSKLTEKKKNRETVELGKPPKFLEDEDIPIVDSCKSGREVLQWLLTPIQVQPFLEKYWEQRPLFISRSFHRNFLQGILSSEDIDKALREHTMQFTKNVDVTTYIYGVRVTHNPVGRAHAFTVWDYYRNGCSVRILNPQTYFKKLRKICTILQECFNSFVGANVYLTPPSSQGFAPHYDDIEAFVLQLEGKKRWKVYPPRKGEKLPRTSSGNFKEEQMKQPVLEIELQPGDLLYMPRGYVHQASTVPNTHSLHVTISTYQHNSWADVMEKVVPAALVSAIASDPEFREGIPWDFTHNAGVVFSTDNTQRRKKIADKIRLLFSKLIDHAPVDAAADQMVKEFLHEALPPMLQSSEVNLSVLGDGSKMKNGDVGHLKQLTMESSVKLIRRNVLRLVSEDDEDTVKIYHCAENPLVYKEDDLKWCEVHVESAPAIEALIRNYPEYTRIADIPVEEDEMKLQIAMTLWERGVLISEEPVKDVSITED